MYSVSYRYNPNTSNPYSIYKQPNPNIHIFYSVYKKRSYSFPYKFGFGRIIRILYTPRSWGAWLLASGPAGLIQIPKKGWERLGVGVPSLDPGQGHVVASSPVAAFLILDQQASTLHKGISCLRPIIVCSRFLGCGGI